MSDGIVRLPGGRQLGYARYGDPEGRPLVVCHGDAQSRLGYRWMDGEAARLMSVAIRRTYASEAGMERLLRRLPEADRALLEGSPAFRAQLLEDALEATRQGAAGTIADLVCYASGPGDLQLARITGPVVFVHGTADTIVKPNVAVAAHRMVPGSRLRWVEGGGHLVIGAHPELLLDEVAPAGR